MMDLTIVLENRPGALADMGEALGRAYVSIEGGGAWVAGDSGTAHFLFEDGGAARSALEAAGIRVVAAREVLIQRLRQDVPGQLGSLTRRMADAGVNIEVLYSDHANQLILVVDDVEKGRQVSSAWDRRPPGDDGRHGALQRVERVGDIARQQALHRVRECALSRSVDASCRRRLYWGCLWFGVAPRETACPFRSALSVESPSNRTAATAMCRRRSGFGTPS